MTEGIVDEPAISTEAASTEVKLVLTEQGYLFENGNQRVGPVSALEVLESTDLDARVAEQLHVPQKAIYSARLKGPSPRLEFVSDRDTHTKFVAEAGQGPDVPASGFIMFDGEEWIAAEATYLYGTLTEVQNAETKSEKVETTECLQRVFFYNSTGNRGKKLSDDAVFKLGTKFLRPTSKTLGGTGPSSLMRLEPAQRFLTGGALNIPAIFDSRAVGPRQLPN